MDFLTRAWQWLLGYGWVQDPPGGQSLGTTALGLARGELGRGEDGGNNVGGDLDRYRRISGTGKPGGPWCASFVSACIVAAAERLGRRGRPPTSASAKRLFKKALASGGVRVEEPRAGDLVLWHRGARNSRKGHIGIVSRIREDGSFHSIEGNRGTYPSRVDEFKHQIGEPLLLGFCRLP